MAAGWAALVVAARGVTMTLPGGWVVRSHDPWPAVLIAGGALLLAWWRRGRDGCRRDGERLWLTLPAAAPWLAAVAAAFTLVAGLVHGTWSAGGADAFGYVSQAEGWARGDPTLRVALAAEAPWPHAASTFAPLGYRADPTGRRIVPTYPPGLPLLMTPLVWADGVRAAFVVVPLFGALLVWLTFLLGRRLCGAVAGAVAAAMVSTSPVVLFQVLQPMSDVPVSALWLGAWLLAARGAPGAALGAGAVASIAVLTRPNLAALVVLTAAVLAAMPPRESAGEGRPPGVTGRLRLAVPFLAGAVPGVALVALLQAGWYGSPFQSGYGAARDLFALRNVWPNFWRYGGWLLTTQGVLVVLAPLGWHVAWHGTRADALPGGPMGQDPARRLLALVLAGGLGVVASYLPYAVFVEWHYLRFMMPGLPLVLAGTAIALVLVAARLPRAVRAIGLVVLVALVAGRSVRVQRAERVFDLAAIEDRYRVTGEAVSAASPRKAVVFSLQQSGSLRLYAQRDTLRWDLLDPAWLDGAVAWLERRGHPVWIVSEQPEDEAFRRRFGSAALGALDWPPRIEVRGSTRVLVHAAEDRARYLAGEPVSPRRVFAK